LESFPFKVEGELQSEVLLLVSDVVSAMELCGELASSSPLGSWADRLVAHNVDSYQTRGSSVEV